MIFVNQLCFVYSVDKTSAATVTLFLGTTPIFIGVVAGVIGLERMGRRFWIAAGRLARRRRLRRLGLGRVLRPRVRRRARGLDGADVGDVLGRDHAADAAVLAVPDLRARARARLGAARVAGSRRRPASRSTSATLVWVGFAFAVVGPLFLTNILWFTAISRVGPSRASLFSNLQPVARRRVRARPPRRAPDPLGGGGRRR